MQVISQQSNFSPKCRDRKWLLMNICEGYIMKQCNNPACLNAHCLPQDKKSRQVIVCFQHLKGECKYDSCQYYHATEAQKPRIIQYGLQRQRLLKKTLIDAPLSNQSDSHKYSDFTMCNNKNDANFSYSPVVANNSTSPNQGISQMMNSCISVQPTLTSLNQSPLLFQNSPWQQGLPYTFSMYDIYPPPLPLMNVHSSSPSNVPNDIINSSIYLSHFPMQVFQPHCDTFTNDFPMNFNTNPYVTFPSHVNDTSFYPYPHTITGF